MQVITVGSRSPFPRASAASCFTAPRAASTRRCSRFRAKAARSAAYPWLNAILLRAPCRQPLLHVGLDVDVEEPTEQGGLSQDEQEIQNSLKLAYDNAIAIGDQKLADQIGNSITFFTRTHVVER